MRKYRRIVAMLCIIYLILAVGLVVRTSQIETKLDNRYRIQITRIQNGVREDSDFLKKNADRNSIKNVEFENYLNNKEIDDVKKVRFLSASITEESVVDAFYKMTNEYETAIVPVIQENRIAGYLRFDYKKEVDLMPFLVLSECFLFVIFLISLLLLIYTGHSILKPFQQLSEMPVELAKGNLNDDIKENKNRYFGHFIWGINMLKDALENHKKKELRLSRDKKMILLAVSHDIKTPLNAITLYAKAIEEGIYESEQEKMDAVIHIQEKTAEINGFVQEIIKSSTEEIVAIDVKNSEYYLEDLIHKVIAGYKEKTELRQIRWELGAYENHILRGDIDRMYEAIGNLIENAYKYGDGASLSITFTEEDYCQLIHIYNSGKPISDNELPHLFDSFFRGSNTEGKQGNGLGLYICHEIMNRMNGDIYVQTHEDGMEFVLVCPIS